MTNMMEYKDYHATINYDAEDGIFVGEVFGITDSLNFHGSSVDELEAMFHQCIDNYLALCAEQGKAPEREFKGSFNVRLSQDLHRKVALQAVKSNMTMNQYISKTLEQSIRM